jgi:death on curing protein
MEELGYPEFVSLLTRLRWQLVEPVDFTQSDPETTAAKVRLLSAAATYFNVLALTEFGDRVGLVRQEGLVEQVVAAAFQTYRGEDPHPEPFDKAAMLMRGITQGHPFTDANKRTGFLLAVYFLDRTGYVVRPELSLSEVVSFSRRVSAGEIRDLAMIAATLRNWTQPRHERSART